MNKIYYAKNQQGRTLKQIETANLIDISDVVKQHEKKGELHSTLKREKIW